MANNNNNNNSQATFWDFFQPDPRYGRGGAGQGVDHMFGPNPSFPQGFPFDPSQFGGWGGNGQWGPWGGPSGRPWGHDHRGHRHGPSAGTEEHSEDDHTETMRPTPDSSEGPSDEDGQPPRGFAHPPPPPPPAGAHPPPPPPAGAHPPPPPPAGAHPPPPPPAGAHPPPPPPPFGRPHHAFGPGPHRGRGGRCGMRGRGGHGGHRGRPGPPPAPFTSPFDFRPLMQAFADHPFAQALRDYVDQTATNGSPNEQQDEAHGEDKFVPPVDIFNTENTYVLHFALPGASKEDIGVHWDSEKSSVMVAGVVYRPGNEELLQSMVSNERKVGMFERSIELPPAGSDKKEEVDGFGITAKMENGILVITVPKVEKDSWTEIHKIDVD